MKKKIYYSLALLLVLTVVLSFTSKSKYITYNDNIKLALNVDGSTQTSIPSKGHYRVDANCGSTGIGSWDYEKWELKVSNAKDAVKCDLTFTSINPSENKFSDKIISLAETPASDYDWTKGGMVVEEHGLDTTTEYRYEGKKVNNYVWFNNELWRIIGVFDEGSHGIAGQNLVKIMRNASIGGISWDARGTDGKTYDSNWEEASLNTLLNEYYYKQRNTNDSGEDVSTYCHGYINSVLGPCDYSTKGISLAYRNMVEENAKWYLKGTTSVSDAKSMFNSERNGSKRSTSFPDYVEKPVGLMYISDYGYSAGSTCATGTSMSSYSSGCASNSWIYGSGYEWTISHNPNSTYKYAGNVYDYGIANYSSACNGLAVRPSLYLNANTYLISGEGTESNPYIIGDGE